MARYVRHSSGLVRQLRWWDVLFITLAAPTGSGILFYSVQTSAHPGGSIAVAFAIGMALFLPMVMASFVLTSAMPRSGGPAVAISRLTHPALGYLAACLLIFGDAVIVGVLGFILMEIGGAILAVVGQAYSLPSVLAFGRAAGSDPWAPIGAVVWVLLFWWIMLQSPRIFRRLLATLLLLPLLTTILTVGIFLATPPTAAEHAFNSVWGADAWGRIIQAAQTNGWLEQPFSWSATFALLLVVVWAFNGIELASYAGGEVQAPQRSYSRGLLYGWLGVGSLYMVTAWAARYSFGGIADAYDFLRASHPQALETIMPAITPSVPFYLMCIVRSPILGILLAIAFVSWFAKIIPTVFLTTSRLMFGLAMDRAIPAKLAEVNPRTAAPTWATHVTAIIALLGVGFYYFKVQAVLGTLMFCTMFIAWPMGLALFRLPLKHPELIRSEALKRRVLGLPVASWLGLVALVAGLVLIYLAGSAIPVPIWIGLVIIIAALLLSFSRRARISSAEGKGEEDLLPPE